MSYRKDLQLLARHGNAAAQCDLARLYALGGEVEQNHETAARWFLKAAEQGHVEAQMNMAVLYVKGQGIAQDAVRALMWSIIASERESEAQEMRDIIASTMSEEQIFMARRMAIKWKPRRTAGYAAQVRPTPPTEEPVTYVGASAPA